MKEFILKNWYYLALLVIALAGFLISVITKRKSGKTNIIDSVKSALLENIPLWAILSEGLISGEDKKNNVLQLGIALATKLLGRNLTPDENSYFVAFISEQLEKILSAPQKKLVAVEKTKKSPYTVK